MNLLKAIQKVELVDENSEMYRITLVDGCALVIDDLNELERVIKENFPFVCAYANEY